MTAPRGPDWDRIVIVGGPSRGKSTLAHELREGRRPCPIPVFCGDPASTVRFQKPYTTYLPEGLDFAGDEGAAQWVCDHWFTMPGPWICEGHVMARALRRWIFQQPIAVLLPCDRIIVLDKDAHRETNRGQEAMHKGVMRVWSSIANAFDDPEFVRVEYRTNEY